MMKIKNYIKGLMFPSLLLWINFSFAVPHIFAQSVTANSGKWQGRAVITSAKEYAYFTDINNENKGSLYDFDAFDPSPVKFALNYDDYVTDFNLSYTLTLYQVATNKSPQFSNKACMFIFTLTKPNYKPEIRVESFNQAACTYIQDSTIIRYYVN